MPANRRDRDDLPRKPKRTRPQPVAPEASEAYDAWCQWCKDETEHQEGDCVPCYSPTVIPRVSPTADGPAGGPE